ncbi:hypothetical protein N7452_011037 [Penicillium brevicompactum]|uniref:Uncharacterized protein n=1 Tax=Penicillium brevicompactum TaxID=5074 RepID=A0A9W9Q396_PENBR|nr:hypothetical protein N7452_011037 [Penicillium brevicompactum]
MANTSPTDHNKPFLQQKESQGQIAEIQKQAEERVQQAEERARQAEERARQAEERGKQAEERDKQKGELIRRTTFKELLHFCHSLLSRPLRVQTPSRSTTGSIPPPTGKYCPTRLLLWADCSARQQQIYSSVYSYLKPTNEDPAHLFTPLSAIKEDARRLGQRPISSEQGLERFEKSAVEEHVCDIIAELCKIDATRDEFGLGEGIWFENHDNFLNPPGGREENVNQLSGIYRPRPDQFCIHRVDGNIDTLLTTVKYKPPHKLSVEALCLGLREMDLWKCMVRSNKITTDDAEKLKYNIERLVCSAIVQEYHMMI